MFSWLWTTLMAIPWWGFILLLVYAISVCIYTYNVYEDVRSYGMLKGFRYAVCGYSAKHFRLHHLLQVIIFSPAMVLAYVLPILKAIFTFKLYTFKDE